MRLAEYIRDLHQLADIVVDSIREGDDLDVVYFWARRLAHVWYLLYDIDESCQQYKR